ncbi:hypothetical protein M0M57_13355 [Flavobacterium azooxidireducens]|uniref:Outer membrane protein beta-barrel domain-containing protein n=1 Tax=Flavobacterium azooxidireducens TaxID=1871076 RepID=A0ABY4KCS6_9FLAO|nr:hypothetical protein [Flavobacterium azooxidireducens]UPQ78603.1 hypothetical protein M0M57_13355 [Flavobacterium azooxidireducens]
MKKVLFTSVVTMCFTICFSQSKGVESSLFNLQTGLLGAWVNNETKLTESIALRSEIGFDAGIFGGDVYGGNSGLFLAPVISLEPRWYYNIKKRETKNKNISNNSANFFTTSISYHPDWFVVGKDNLQVFNQMSFIPKWGIRRNIANSNFNFETGIGIGYRYYFLKQYGYIDNDSEIVLDLHLRIGYTFKKNNK